MPHEGHRYGGAVPDNLKHHEARLGIRLRADKLTVPLRTLAQQDDAVAAYLRRRVSEAARFDAFMAGRGHYSGRVCPRCGSTRRRVYDCCCLDCRISRRPLQLRPNGSIAAWPAADRSRAGWLALMDAQRREREGEQESRTFGIFTATLTPAGRLAVSAPSIPFQTDDLRSLDYGTINRIQMAYPDLLQVMQWAGWL